MENNREQYLKNYIKDYLESDDEINGKLLKQLRFQIYALDEGQSDIYMLSKILPEKYVVELIKYYGEDCLRLPDQEKFYYLNMIAIIYFLRKEKKMEWSKIRKDLKLSKDDSRWATNNLSKEVQRIDEGLDLRTKQSLSRLGEKSLEKILQEYFD